MVREEPLRTSAGLGWRGVFLEEQRVASFDQQDVFFLNHVVFLQLEGTMNMEWKEGGDREMKRVEPGQLCLAPAGAPHTCRCGDTVRFMGVSLEPGFVQLACAPEVDLGQLEVPFHHGVEDRFMEGVCLALREEVRRGGASGKLYSESLATSLAMHLFGRYGARKISFGNGSGGLPRRELRLAVDFIHDQIERNLALRDMAAAAGLSPFHFARLFKRSLGVSPYQYVLRQRIEKAKQLLMAGHASIAAVATKVGFCDQSHFSAHFKRFCGMTPKQFANGFRRRKNLS